MPVEIEYHKGDTLLYGTKISFGEFKRQIGAVEKLYDKKEDNFVALLCRMYHWTVVKDVSEPRYIYDRDAQKSIKVVS